MDRTLIVDLFAEDRAHEQFLGPLITRLAADRGKRVNIRTRSARGGHGRVIAELRLYEKVLLEHPGSFPTPDILVVGTDANCQGCQPARKAILDALATDLQRRTVVACPDPHVERWFFAEREAFTKAVGLMPPGLSKQKCQRDFYKRLLAQTVVEAGHPRMLGGIEFAREIVDAMDLYRAGKNDRSLGLFLDDLGALLESM